MNIYVYMYVCMNVSTYVCMYEEANKGLNKKEIRNDKERVKRRTNGKRERRTKEKKNGNE